MYEQSVNTPPYRTLDLGLVQGHLLATREVHVWANASPHQLCWGGVLENAE